MLILEIQGKEGRFEARSVKAAATLPGWAALPQRFIASTWWRWLNSNISMLLNTAQFCIRRDISLEKKKKISIITQAKVGTACKTNPLKSNEQRR